MRTVSISQLHPCLKADDRSIESLFLALDTLAVSREIPQGELSIALLDDEQISKLHADFLDDPSPTDVITFPGDPDMEFVGEICLGVDSIAQFAKANGITLSMEINRCLIHGWLHLAGYQDDTPQARSTMRQAEDHHLQLLGERGLLPCYSWQSPKQQKLESHK